MPDPITENTLFYGDNLPILREYIPSASVDLIYLDPPFNSNRTYNVLFRQESGAESEAQIAAFEDTWHWNRAAEQTFYELVQNAPPHVAQMIDALRGFIGQNQMMAYLVMMAARLVELHRVLKPTGSLYLHCDPTASHYLKIVLDTIFGPENFRNEIVWAYRKWTTKQAQFASNHDVILFYTKSKQNTFHTLYTEVSEGTKKRWKGKKQKAVFVDGVRQATSEDDEGAQTPMPDWWIISILNPNAAERLGYPTQKPLALLERIISASSNPGDVVLDPFCGCGTTIAAAQKLGRRWIGIDITHLSIALQKYRLREMFPDAGFRVIGEPTTEQGARQLAREDRYQFQWWALSLIRARPFGGETSGKTGKKGSDRGIDGLITFIDDNTSRAKRVIVQVKSGKVKSGDIRDLKGTVEREGAAIGVFLTLEPPTREMNTEAATAGFYQSPGWGTTHPRLQILTVGDLLTGTARVDMPPTEMTFKTAGRVKDDGPGQGTLFDRDGD